MLPRPSKLKAIAPALAIIVLLFSTIAQTATFGATDETVINFNLLEQREALTRYMSPGQQMDLIELESALRTAERKLRSGEFLAATKPSTLDPNRNVQATVARGKKLIAESEVAIESTRIKMVRLLEQVSAQAAQKKIVDLTRYDFNIETAQLKDAFPKYAERLLNTFWAKGYDTLFFENAFLRESESLKPVDSGLRNQFYDDLVAIDGNKFSIRVPTDFKLELNADGKNPLRFAYENSKLFERDKKALLVIEFIRPDASGTGLLFLRAVDLESKAIIAGELVKISDLATALGIDLPDLEDKAPEKVELRDPEERIALFDRLTMPYHFRLESDSNPTAKFTLAALAQALLRQTDLKLLDNVFVLDAYGDSLEATEPQPTSGNAQISVEKGDQDDTWFIRASADDSDRKLALGELRLN